MASETSEIPKTVRIRTDPADGHAHRFDAIQAAGDVLGERSKTGAVVAACDHARHDRDAKQDALAYLARHVPADVLQETAARLSTPAMGLRVSIDVHAAARAPGPARDSERVQVETLTE